ncbi:MAG: patatin-like phospholipase family protein [Alphaproteobacteria bacterium]|nr:patatin-like phospholipase family protein [Alphaproteobacteria bacterium]
MADHIAARLHAPAPKRILALDGGGTRGIITLAFLERIEATLQKRLGRGDDFVLADYFDMIGGTSVGSMLAAQLAQGKRVAEVRSRFETAAPRIFGKPRWYERPRFGIFRPRFEAGALTREIKDAVKEETMAGDGLKTGIAIVMKRMDTGSVWPISNNPAARYWKERPIPNSNRVRRGNKDYKLWELIRSSTAAPHYFMHHAVQIFDGLDDGLGEGKFIDGAVSPHNSPALKLFMMAAIKGYNLGGGELTKDGGGKAWDLGGDNLLLVSVGTGLYSSRTRTSGSAAWDAMQSLQGMIADGTDLGLILLQWLGHSGRPWVLDREVRSLAQDVLHVDGREVGPLLGFQRYDMRLDKDDLNIDRCADVDDVEMALLRDMVEPGNIRRLYELASASAVKQVTSDDFPAAFDQVWHPATRIGEPA